MSVPGTDDRFAEAQNVNRISGDAATAHKLHHQLAMRWDGSAMHQHGACKRDRHTPCTGLVIVAIPLGAGTGAARNSMIHDTP